ncbi:uncharacterized protein OCT59_002810 [Rhizophagus irregularis]|uniref:uncharacterized protein n=1 Tax=Rhizophagus irregularis TaxID=588596 RepID=UPI00332912B0|nr:hypothetical protein OCT59_002810 [Rhizophagus irregularis]
MIQLITKVKIEVDHVFWYENLLKANINLYCNLFVKNCWNFGCSQFWCKIIRHTDPTLYYAICRSLRLTSI